MKSYGVRMLTDVKVPMRDGARLSADVYLPDGGGRFPTALLRTPYQNNLDLYVSKARRFASLGYACVVQDCRGRFDSEGTYYPFLNEAVDGFDTQEWIGSQSWSSGRIGMMGGSYEGWVQFSSATLASQYLTCIAPQVIAPDLYRGMFFRGGVPLLNTLMTWAQATSGRTNQVIGYDNWNEAFRTLPLVDADSAAGYELPFWKDWFAHPTYDEYWQPVNLTTGWSDFTVPVLNLGGWFDLFSNDTCQAFSALRDHGGSEAARKSKLIMGPWWHVLSQSTKTGDVEFGAASRLDLESEELRWFDHWLRDADNGVLDEPPVRLFVMGTNVWRDEHEWPLARTDWQEWFIHSHGHANTLLGDGTLDRTAPAEETHDSFVYHPDFPVQTLGGCNCCWPDVVAIGPYDQRDVEMRHDVLCYTSEVLEQDLEVTGPIKLVLYAATDGLDTDWTGKLVDVSPSGYATNLCDGIIRARSRESVVEPTLLEPGEVYRFEIDLMVTSNVFLKDHRIRVEISSSNFPRYDRNLNTGHAIGTDSELRAARQTVLHSPAYPSHILLPVIAPV
jgi:putative CocE/NonD family hydrolase